MAPATGDLVTLPGSTDTVEIRTGSRIACFGVVGAVGAARLAP